MTSNERPTIKIFEIEDIQENGEILNAWLIQEIFMPINVSYAWNDTVYIEADCLCKEINFFQSDISTPKGSFLFFNSILPQKNYSLMKQQEAESCFLRVQQAKDKELEEKNKKKAFKNSSEYKNAIEEYTFSRKLAKYSTNIVIFGFYFFPVSFSAIFFLWFLLDIYFVNHKFYISTISTFFASIVIMILAGKREDNLLKNFPGVDKVYLKKMYG
jgi:hypothetical protein